MSSFNFDGDGEDAEENWDGAITGRNCFVLMIDAGSDMFTRTENGKSYFHLSVEVCKEILLSIARKQKMELVAIVFYGTSKTEGKHAPENVVLFEPLSVVTVTKIKRLMQLLEGKCEEIAEKYGHSKTYRLAHALHYCQTLILESRTKVYVKNIILFTCNDNPHDDDVKLQHQTRKQAEELLGHHIDFDVVGLGRFDSSKFYKELVLTSRGELLKDWANRDPILNVAETLNQINRITEKFTQRRSYLCLSDKCVLQVALFKLYNEPRKFRTEKVSKQEMEKIEGRSKVVKTDEDEDDLGLEPDNIGENDSAEAKASASKFVFAAPKEAYVSVGGRTVPITKSELRNFNIPGVKMGFNLVGFVTTAHIPMYFFKGEPYLMIPASNVANVRLIFSHLVQGCLRKEKSMVGWFKLTKSSPLRYVALHPTPGGEYADGKEHSAGFIMNTLSFTEDLMEPEEPKEKEAEPSAQQLEAADAIVKKLTIPFSVDSFSDAEVRYRTNMIEALALDHDDVQEVEDDTDADLEDIDNRLGDLNSIFNDCDHLPQVAEGGKKAGPSKNTISPTQAVEMVRNGFAHKLNVAQLKEILKNEGVKNLSAMNKAMMVSVANKRFGGQ